MVWPLLLDKAGRLLYGERVLSFWLFYLLVFVVSAKATPFLIRKGIQRREGYKTSAFSASEVPGKRLKIKGKFPDPGKKTKTRDKEDKEDHNMPEITKSVGMGMAAGQLVSATHGVHRWQANMQSADKGYRWQAKGLKREGVISMDIQIKRSFVLNIRRLICFYVQRHSTPGEFRAETAEK